MSYPFGTKATVANGEQTDLVVTGDDRICLYHNPMGCGIFLGAATPGRIDEIIANLRQLRDAMPEAGQERRAA